MKKVRKTCALISVSLRQTCGGSHIVTPQVFFLPLYFLLYFTLFSETCDGLHIVKPLVFLLSFYFLLYFTPFFSQTCEGLCIVTLPGFLLPFYFLLYWTLYILPFFVYIHAHTFMRIFCLLSL